MTAPPAQLLDIDSAIERWHAATGRLTATQMSGTPQRSRATVAFKCLDTALAAERGSPIDLEDFAYRPRVIRPGAPFGYEIALYGVQLGHAVYEQGAEGGWSFHPSAAIAASDDERVPLGTPARALAGSQSTPTDPQRIGEALNDAAIVCLLRLRKPTP